MLSIFIFVIIFLSLLFSVYTNALTPTSFAVLEGAGQAIQIVLSLAGPLCLWCGVGELLRRSGLRNRLAQLTAPLLNRLFPELKTNKDGASALSANVTANLLGLGNAATPMGIAACKAMNDGSGIATNAQCRLIVMNTASIQLLPTTIAALRSSLGCKTPLDILPCVLLSSLCSVTMGLLACRLFERTSK